MSLDNPSICNLVALKTNIKGVKTPNNLLYEDIILIYVEFV